jgi:hypothetical protein
MRNTLIGIWLIIGTLIACASVYRLNNPGKQFPKAGSVYEAIATRSLSEQIDICSQDKSEEFIYSGTYRPMIGGSYIANFDVEGNGRVFYDVVSAQGTRLQDSRELSINTDQKSISVDFNVKYYQDDIELRLRHLDNSRICVNSLAVERTKIDWGGNLRGVLLLVKTVIS